MELAKLLQWRYATKAFDPEKKISDAELAQLKNLLRFSPSSVNLQPWYFLIVGSEEAKKQILRGLQGFNAYNQSKVRESSHTIVCCIRQDISSAYMEALLDLEAQAGRFPNEAVKARVAEVRANFAELHRSELRDFKPWLKQQLFLNLGHFVLGSASLGIDSLIMEGADFRAIDEAFGLNEEGLEAVALVSIGYRADDDANEPSRSPKARFQEEDIIKVL